MIYKTFDGEEFTDEAAAKAHEELFNWVLDVLRAQGRIKSESGLKGAAKRHTSMIELHQARATDGIAQAINTDSEAA